MKLKKLLLAATVATLGASSSAFATPIDVGGVIWNPDSALDFSSFSIAIRQHIDSQTGVLSGFGFVSTINGTGQTTFCPGCELTFAFSGYTPFNAGALPTATGQNIEYSGGSVQVYVDNTPEITDPSDPTTLTAANTTDGNLWLSLVGNGTFVGTVLGVGTTITGLSGLGNLDVVGGLAQGNLDTDTQPNGSDITFSTSFTLFFPSNPKNLLDAAGTGNFFGASIPEPGSLALVGLALLGLGALRRRC